MKICIKTNLSLNVAILANILFAGIALFSACTKADHTAPGNTTSSDIPDSNLISNAGFSEWDASQTLPINWEMRQSAQNSDAFTPTHSGVNIKGNSEEEYLLFQTITVEPNTFYKVSTAIKYEINNSSAGGLYIFDAATRTLLGKYEKSNSNGEALFELLFHSRSANTVSVEIGFPDGMSGSFDCGPVEVVQQYYEPYISKTGFSDYINQKTLLSFSADQLDSSISLLCDYTNSILQSVIKGYDLLAGELSKLQTLLINRDEYVYLPYYLSTPDSASVAYCQRASLSLQEILTNEFNIPTKAVHLQDDTQTGFHQLLQYWNPFREKWIAIDPYFSFRYQHKDGSFFSAEELQNETAPWEKIAPFGQYAFSTSIEELQEMWHNKAYFMIGASHQLSYPF